MHMGCLSQSENLSKALFSLSTASAQIELMGGSSLARKMHLIASDNADRCLLPTLALQVT